MVVKVAVIGSGLAGLTTGYLLSRYEDEGIEVHLFEKAESIGMDHNSWDYEIPGSSSVLRIDSPMRALQGGTHNAIFALYSHFNIPLTKRNWKYAFLRRTPIVNGSENLSNYLIYNGSSGLSLEPLTLPRSNMSFFERMTYFGHCVKLVIGYLFLLLISASYVLSTVFFGDSLAARWKVRDLEKLHVNLPLVGEIGIGKNFVEEVIVPLFACVATTSAERVKEGPVGDVLFYCYGTIGTNHYIATFGVRPIVARLSSALHPSNIHLGVKKGQVNHITRQGSKFRVITASSTHTFDHVIFALPPHACKNLVMDCIGEGELVNDLRKFESDKSVVVDHGWDGVLGGDEKKRRDLTIVLPGDKTVMVGDAEEEDRLRKAWWNGTDWEQKVMANTSSNGYQDSETSSLSDSNDHCSSSGTSTPPSSCTSPVLNAAKLPQSFIPLPASSYVMASHIVSSSHPLLMELSPSQLPSSLPLLIQTTNPTMAIPTEKILNVAYFERVISTIESRKVLQRFIPPKDLNSNGKKDGINWQGFRGVWFVGSWVEKGIPLLEGCVTSSEKVVEMLIKKEGMEWKGVEWKEKK